MAREVISVKFLLVILVECWRGREGEQMRHSLARKTLAASLTQGVILIAMADKLDIELYKNRFQNSLVGKWTTIEGTFSIMSDTFEFYEDGKGIWTQSSGSGECVTYFNWKIDEPFVVNILETKVEYLPDSGTADDNQKADIEQWHKLEYDFKIISNDCGNEIALCNKNSELFYFAMQRIGLQKNKTNGQPDPTSIKGTIDRTDDNDAWFLPV